MVVHKTQGRFVGGGTVLDLAEGSIKEVGVALWAPPMQLLGLNSSVRSTGVLHWKWRPNGWRELQTKQRTITGHLLTGHNLPTCSNKVFLEELRNVGVFTLELGTNWRFSFDD